MSNGSPPPLVHNVKTLRARISSWRRDGKRIALVPTMGALHAGHLSLIKIAAQQADKVVVTVFVNPTQFAPGEDFERYPRTLDSDLNALAPTPADLVYAPDGAEMYPEGFASEIHVAGPSGDLEGAARPQMFGGVATVVAKLFNQAQPDCAVFGEKDYQQLLVIKRLVRDLDFDLDIIAAPTLREPDGLALSSRNAYLSADERARAPRLHTTLQNCAARLKSGGDPATVIADGVAALEQAGFGPIDYIALRDAATLEPITSLVRPARLLAAAKLGQTRLIDNIPV